MLIDNPFVGQSMVEVERQVYLHVAGLADHGHVHEQVPGQEHDHDHKDDVLTTHPGAGVLVLHFTGFCYTDACPEAGVLVLQFTGKHFKMLCCLSLATVCD